jgi:hypothetical protein
VNDLSVGSFYPDVDVEKSSFCDFEHQAHLRAGLHLVEETLLGVSVNLKSKKPK